MSDKAGKNWILRNTPQNKLHSLCFHDPELSALKAMNLVISENNNYSEFGKDKFIKLTTFKWQLIHDSLSSHTDLKGALFSDLDVFWFLNPFQYDLMENTSKILAQDDTPKSNKEKHFCSGIMFFPNSSKSKEVLDSLFYKQLESNSAGNLIPDEPILNQWFQSTKYDAEFISTLNSKRFVIGHRFFHVMFWRRYTREKMVCFHFNYVIGELRKWERGKALLNRMEGNHRWIIYYAFELFRVVLERISKK